MSVSLATGGKYWPQAGYGIAESKGIGGGGGAGLERPKPVVRVSSVRYDKYKKKNINIILKDINYE